MIKSKEIIFQGYDSVRTLPANFKKEEELFFKQDFKKHINDTVLYQYKNVIINTQGLVLNNLKIQEELLLSANGKKNYNFRYFLSCFVRNRIKFLSSDETYTLISNPWSAGYFHFLCDSLPRLIALGNKIKDTVLLLPESHNDFHLEFLEFFKPKKILFYKETQLLFCPKLLIANHTAPTGNYNKNVLNILKKKLLEGYNAKSTINGDKKNIYISRKKATRRRILNEAEFEEVLLKYNFQIICSEDYNTKEKIDLFKDCDLLVSIHGAGLTNILFMPEKSIAVEVRMPNDKTNLAYFTLASDLNINYYYMFSESPNDKSIDYTINTIELEKILNQIVNSK